MYTFKEWIGYGLPYNIIICPIICAELRQGTRSLVGTGVGSGVGERGAAGGGERDQHEIALSCADVVD